MTPEALTRALEQGVPVHSPTKPSPVRPVSEVLGCSDQDALEMARAKGLIGEDNVLRCWHCKQPCDWHVSLHCAPCRFSAPARKREQDRIAKERQTALRQRQSEQSTPPARVGGRSFRDGY